MNNNEPTLRLVVPASMYNMIIAGLEELPHKYSRPVIDELAKQSKEQINQQQNNLQGPLSNKVV
jgi:hypothetical protein